MNRVTRKPSGLSIKRSGNKFWFSWKIGDKDYGAGQTLQYRLKGRNKWGKWIDLSIGYTSTKRVVTINTNQYYPHTKTLLSAIQFRVRGKRKPYKEDKKEAVTPTVSEWATKDYDILIPNTPTLTAELDPSRNNICKFTWKTAVASDVPKWFDSVEIWSVRVKSSAITDGAKIKGWQRENGSTANGNISITEDSSIINMDTSYTRWVRIRSRGPQGYSAWRYAKHVYAFPYQTKNVRANAYLTEVGGYLCKSRWETVRGVAHPIDAINVQYMFAIPAEGMTCPDGVSPTDAQTLAYKDGSDAAAFSIDNVVGIDQCLFVRINTIHDRNTTYGQPVLAAVGTLATPTNLSVAIDQSTHMAEITVTNASQVTDSFIVVTYKTASDPNGFNIGIIPHGQQSVIVHCPDFTSTDNIHFSVFAAVGEYTETTRADGTTSYAVKVTMKSTVLEYGGSVPAAPENVQLSMTGTPGTIRVTYDWTWALATSAELSWADHDDAWESTAEPNTYIINKTHASAWNISGLETGKIWYVRVRLTSGEGDSMTYGAYSDIVSIDLSSAPNIPILSLSSAVITEDGSVTASWAYTSTDGTGQSSAEIAELVNSTYTVIAETASAQNITLSDMGWTSGETHLLAVRVTSESGKQSAWSDAAAVTVAEPIEIALVSTSLVEQTITEDSETRTVMSLTEMPLTLTVTGAGNNGTTRVVIERAEDYHVDRPDESTFNGFEGETVAIFSQLGEALITIDNDDLVGILDDGASYRLIATVQDGLGQSAEVEQAFEVHWSHQASAPDAFARVLDDDMVAVLTPIAPSGALATDVCDIYRLSADKPTLIYPGATFGVQYVDPYPTLGEHGGHRFVTRTANGDYITPEDMLAWVDVTAYDGDFIDSASSIIDFGTGRVALGLNIDLSSKWQKDFVQTKYLGGSIQGDWNPAVSRTGSMNTVVYADDQETIDIMRRLAEHAGICHVRTTDGSSYAADVQVSESWSQQNSHRLVSFSLSITKVDPESYDGMTYAEWIQTGG